MQPDILPQPAEDGASLDPSYTHTAELTTKGHAWCILGVVSSGSSKTHIPCWFDDKQITGTLHLNLEKDDPIKAVFVTLYGELLTSVYDVSVFLEISQELWSTAKGDPRAPPLASPTRFTGKLRGLYSWPFSISLPETVALNIPGGGAETVHLPPSFHKRLARGTVQYRIEALIKRSGFLQVNQSVEMKGFYTPTIRPEPPSQARMLAYQMGSPLIGPAGDPEGWTTLSPVMMKGVLFRKKDAEAAFTLSLARPLQYTRGNVIPLELTVESSDPQIVSILSAPASVRVRLQLDLEVPEDATLQKAKHVSTLPHKTETRDLNAATWWSSAYENGSVEEKLKRRVLSGEIKLPIDLAPSFHLAKFRVHYKIALFPSQVTGFVPSDDLNMTLLTLEVEIVTAYAPGPRPLVYATPDSREDLLSADEKEFYMPVVLV